MCNRIQRFHQAFYVFLFLTVGIFDSFCLEKVPFGPHIYRLSRGGYSANTNVLLFAVHFDKNELMKGVFLATYDEKKGLAKYLFPISPAPFDFAWAPGRDLFAVTHGDRISLFRKSTSKYDYKGTAIQCPLNVNYTYCTWNTKGNWLAVNCYDLEEAPGFHKLGLYRLVDSKFVISNIVIDHRPPVWKNDTTLYVTNDNKVVEVRVDSGIPKLARTIPLEADTELFYSIFDGQALTQKSKKIKLGNRTLVELDQHSRTGVIATDTSIFVSASSTSLVVFDIKGNKLSQINPEKAIRFGSVGENPNTVYGLVGSVLLCLRMENGSLNIQEVCDLANF